MSNGQDFDPMQVTPEHLARLREVQTQDEKDHDDGFDAGGEIDTTKSEAYQLGQMARREVEEEG